MVFNWFWLLVKANIWPFIEEGHWYLVSSWATKNERISTKGYANMRCCIDDLHHQFLPKVKSKTRIEKEMYCRVLLIILSDNNIKINGFVLDYLLLEITTPLIVYIWRRHEGTCKFGFEFYWDVKHLKWVSVIFTPLWYRLSKLSFSLLKHKQWLAIICELHNNIIMLNA
jgi:hypothetical protein